ncbi:RNA polymerase sigma factor [Phaeodactylibacter xiamenensis]|uniref:RNA polymerase sigma factor n=1 Tax=Phaeodactylibacter xiamenensis TaxID=1524460 RepID=UPI0024A8C1BA|nr:RNA polymerase sigma factor [Phaeodactylibacter xiamenensis]
MPETNDCIERAKRGDTQAFRLLVEQHQGQVRAMARSMLGAVPEADDVAQEVFIRLHQALPDFRGDAKLSTYLSRIAINLSLNELKRRKRKGRWLTFTRSDGPELQVEDTAARPERQDLQDALQQAMQQLGPEFRAVVTLRLMKGYSVKETADILGLPQGTIASRLARAQQKLRLILEPWL